MKQRGTEMGRMYGSWCDLNLYCSEAKSFTTGGPENEQKMKTNMKENSTSSNLKTTTVHMNNKINNKNETEDFYFWEGIEVFL